MRALYIFPHPDDESFGPGPAIARQAREGHEIFLLTLTRGGATKVRHELGLSIAEMGEVRRREMDGAARALGLSGLHVLDFPDGGLAAIDPRSLEHAVAVELERTRPDVVVTYAVHGVSGFPDHLVAHAVVKRVWYDRPPGSPTRRLALYTLAESAANAVEGPFRLASSSAEAIDVLVDVTEEDIAAGQRALNAYETYQATIERTGIRRHLGPPVAYEFQAEEFDPPVGDLFASLDDPSSSSASSSTPPAEPPSDPE